MNYISKALLILLSLQALLTFGMDAPDGWQPIRPSISGRPSRPGHPPHPRPYAIIYGTTPINTNITDINAHNPQVATDDAAINLFTNPIGSTQPQIANPMHIINMGDPIAAVSGDATNTSATIMATGPTVKEQERLEKIEKDLDKIEEVLKEMGFDLAATALSGIALDPIGASFAASNSVITIPKLVYYYGNMQKHIFFLSTSNTSPQAKVQLKKLTPRLKTISEIIIKIGKVPKALKQLAQQIIISLSSSSTKP